MRNFAKFIFSVNFLYILLIAAQTAAIIFLCLYIPQFMSVAAAVCVVWLATLITVTVIVCGKSSEINCALILFIIALPLAGVIIYCMTRLAKKERGSLKINGAEKLRGMYGAAGYYKAEYFKCGDEYFSLLFKEIERAETSVYLEYFIICRGEIFNRLLSALRAAKKRGADIRIIFDGVGSAFKIGKKEIKKLKNAGAEIKIFHKLTPFSYSRLNFRDHRKIAVIDGRVAFTGGFNIADEYANIDSPYGFWKDTGIAVYGGAAKIFEGMFLAVWNGGHEMQAPPAEKYTCLPYCDSPPAQGGFCENAYVAAISAAKERVHIFTPYFCAGEKISSALQFAAGRGVDVRIIIPHIPDKKYAFELSKASAKPLAEAGVKFYEYTPGFMHAKSMVCDGKLFIGSYNLDFRSLRLNFECGIMFEGKLAEHAERDFWESLRLSSPLNEDKLTAARKAYRFALKLFAPLM